MVTVRVPPLDAAGWLSPFPHSKYVRNVWPGGLALTTAKAALLGDIDLTKGSAPALHVENSVKHVKNWVDGNGAGYFFANGGASNSCFSQGAGARPVNNYACNAFAAGWFDILGTTDQYHVLQAAWAAGSYQFILYWDPVGKNMRFSVSMDGTVDSLGTDYEEVNIAHAFATGPYFLMAYHDGVNGEIGISLDGGAFTTKAWANGVHAPAGSHMDIGTFSSSTLYAYSAVGDQYQGLWLSTDDIAGAPSSALAAIRDGLYNSGDGNRLVQGVT